ncbi:MAG: endonuclease/exonuclease/phosphatase family protein [Microgenomates group bacterium]
MNFSLLTYNTLFNSGVADLKKIVSRYLPDFICLQEFLIDENNIKNIEKLGYKMAEYNNSFIKLNGIYGVITFYNKNRFQLLENGFFDLSKNISEYFYNIFKFLLDNKYQPRTVLKTDFLLKKTQKKISLINLHLFVVGTNEARLSSLKKILNQLDFKKHQSMIICGDFNYYPYRRRKLEVLMKKFGFSEATKKISQTINPLKNKTIINQYLPIQKFLLPLFKKFFAKSLKIDYIFYRNLKNIKTIKIENHYSDHYPILSYFKI